MWSLVVVMCDTYRYIGILQYSVCIAIPICMHAYQYFDCTIAEIEGGRSGFMQFISVAGLFSCFPDSLNLEQWSNT